MHEMAVTQSILEIALRHADGASQITQLNLVIGELSGIVGESVQFYWDFITQGTIAEGSRLNFKSVKTRFLCHDCAVEYAPEGGGFECPHCGGHRVSISAGKEFQLESIEVE